MRRLNGIYNVLVLETPHQEEQSVIQIHRESPEATGGDYRNWPTVSEEKILYERNNLLWFRAISIA